MNFSGDKQQNKISPYIISNLNKLFKDSKQPNNYICLSYPIKDLTDKIPENDGIRVTKSE